MDVGACTQAIARDFPALALGTPDVMLTRHSCIIEMAADGVPHIFKFPLNDKLDWRQEVGLLQYLHRQGFGPAPVPDLTGASAAYFAYPLLAGEAARGLVQEQYEGLASDENAVWLADVLLRLHHISTEGVEIRPDPSLQYPQRVADFLPALPDEAADLAGFLKALVDRARHDPAEAPRHLIHNDLHLANMIVASGSSRLVALIDFGFAALGDRHRDFCQLERQHPLLLEKVLVQYNARSSAAPIDRGRMAYLAALDQAAYYAAACTTLASDVMTRAEILDGLRAASREPLLLGQL